jgi:hypothetical protein
LSIDFAAKIRKKTNKPKIHIDFWDYNPKKYIDFWDYDTIPPPILHGCRDTTALQPCKTQLSKPSIIDTNSFALGIMGRAEAHTSTILSCSTLW